MPSDEEATARQTGTALLRRVRRRSQWRAVIGVLLLVGGLTGFGVAGNAKTKLQRTGVHTTATVAYFAPYPGASFPYIVVQFTDRSGVQRDARISVGEEASYDLGQRVRISYDAAHPSDAVFARGQPDIGAIGAPFFFALCVGIVLLVGAILWMRPLRRARRALAGPAEGMTATRELATRGRRRAYVLTLRDAHGDTLELRPVSNSAWLPGPDSFPVVVMGDASERSTVVVVDRAREAATFGRLRPARAPQRARWTIGAPGDARRRSARDSPQTQALVLRGSIVTSAGQFVFFAVLLALERTVSVGFAVALGGAAVAAAVVLLVRFRAAGKGSPEAAVTDPLTIGADDWLQRRKRRALVWTYALTLGAEAAVALVLVGAHVYANGSCAAAGISTLAAREGTCEHYSGLFGSKTVYRVVDAGHVLRMPGYDVRLLAARVAPTPVTNAQLSPRDYPNGQGQLVSYELTVTNVGAGALLFDAAGHDVTLDIDDLDRPGWSLSFLDLPNANGEPGPSIADAGVLAPQGTATGWVSFVAPSWATQVLGERAADLEFFRPGDEAGYTGEIRLWKAAGAQGRAAVRFRPVG